MAAEMKYRQDLQIFCGALAKSCKYNPVLTTQIAAQMLNFLLEYRYFKAKSEVIALPGSYPCQLITLSGQCDTQIGPNKVSVPVKIILTPNFPSGAPQITINVAECAGRPLVPQDYIFGNDIRIPYLTSWNVNSMNPSNLNVLMKYISSTFAARPPFSVPGYGAAPKSGASAVGYGPPRPSFHAPGGYSAGPQYYRPPAATLSGPPPVVDGMPSEHERPRLTEEIKKKLAEVSKEYFNEAKRTVQSLQAAELELNKNEQALEFGKKKLQERQSQMVKETEEVEKLTSVMAEEATKSETIEIREDNVLNFVKPSSGLQDKWLNLESKCQAIEDIILQAKKSFEGKEMKFEDYLSTIRKLTSKEFLCIFKKAKIESIYKSQKTTTLH